MTATSSCCEILQRSTAASVCPALRSTPPSIAWSGNIWPGILNESLVDSLLAKPFIVLNLSSAEIPVVTPSPFKSTEWVYGVCISLVTPSINGNLSFFATVDDIGEQTNPLPYVIIKLICSAVRYLEEITKSPSFSLSSSSTNIIISPFEKRLIMVLISVIIIKFFQIFYDYIIFNIYTIVDR